MYRFLKAEKFSKETTEVHLNKFDKDGKLTNDVIDIKLIDPGKESDEYIRVVSQVSGQENPNVLIVSDKQVPASFLSDHNLSKPEEKK